ncbi:MAG: anhydro-N-acetylmuramic acid kinase [Kutzneria sp.]|nr:anhydro-N-acetylmuramic acid kinase [Kutzneria sp.]MBV9845325.1 anhydro-N-acetylmuramic acid kinase [Kutzneria sp.]
MRDAVAAQRVIGLISGTSMDGIDVAVADLGIAGATTDAPTIELAPLGDIELAYPERLRERLLAVLPPAGCTAAELCELDTLVGQAFAGAAERGIAELAAGKADLIASLGQTIYHWVDAGRCLGTLQLGQPAWIAEATGRPVVSDLRARDVAAGGQGAPLASTLDTLWLTELAHRDGTPLAALNLGGIANITVVAPGSPALAYDTGPGNALLDLAARRAGRPWDAEGELAAAGTPDRGLLDRLLADPYYQQSPPKSTGKERFHSGYLDNATGLNAEGIGTEDLLATLVELTAITVADACRAHGAARVIASGGGVRNPTLMRSLAARLAPAEITTSDQFGLPAHAKEAHLTALLGFLTWNGIAASTPSATGASGARLLGSVTPGLLPLRPSGPPSRSVKRLRVI